MSKEVEVSNNNFIRQIVREDNESGKWDGKVVTRFPPEPNGHLHIGHAKALLISYNIAQENGGQFHLRFDDTNPEKESNEFVDSIQKDLKWLGCHWDHLHFASDYFDTLYEYATRLIESGDAFVCELPPEEIRKARGSLTEPGTESPYRNRSIEESLTLFKKMRAGEFEEGTYSLRAKIDMSAPNMNMRDPVIYRIRKVHHHRTGDAWPIYPMYDFTHPLSDSLEGITHSLCSLEFEDHRPLYDWSCVKLGVHHPQQIEFARLNLEYTIMSKRHLKTLVEDKHVNNWDDPRMPTLSGMRRRGYPPEAIAKFCEAIGVTKKNSVISMSLLETIVRDELGETSERRLAVAAPLRVTIKNWEDGIQNTDAANHPKKPEMGRRDIPFGKNLYIDRSDFMENPPKKFFRLSPGGSVRLRYAYVITCEEVVKDEQGNIIELICTYNKDTFKGVTPEGMKKIKGIVNWVSADHAVDVEMQLYDRLFTEPNPSGDPEKSFLDFVNPNSLVIGKGKVEPSILDGKVGDVFQFERLGYFRIDENSTDNKIVVNRVTTLRDTWEKKK